MATFSLSYSSLNQCLGSNLNKKIVSSRILEPKYFQQDGGTGKINRKLSLKRKTNRNQHLSLTRQLSFMPSSNNDDFWASPPTPLETIEQFYNCINSKNLYQLRELISNDCCFEDYTFTEPFKGEREVMEFFKQLTEGMSKNVKFVTQIMCKSSDEQVVATMWHLEWKGKQIPFTRGCSFFECVQDRKFVVIKHARVLIESPIKPGAMALSLLKFVTSVFDDFPVATEKFLQRPHVVLQFLIRIYNIFVEPLIHPLLVLYINLGKFIVGLLRYAISMLANISRVFFK